MKKILAIDDQRDNLISLKAVIETQLKNCKVLMALSGKEGIEIAKNEQPDTILLDIIMPVMDGFEVCKQLKTDDLTKHIPIIMVTAVKIDTKNRVKSLNLGADAFISKPIDNIELCAQVNVMLRIKEAEDKLRLEKEQLDKMVVEKTKEIQYQSTVLTNVTDPIISTDMDRRIVSWNKAAEELYGYSEKEVKGKKFREILKPDYMGYSADELVEEILKKGKYSGEMIHHKKDGTKLILNGSVSLIKDSDGNDIGFVSVNHDITLRKEAIDVSLKLSEAIYHSNEVIFLTDKEGIITFINPEFTRMYGYSAEEVVGKLTPRVLKSGDINEEGYEQFWKLLISKQSVPAVAYSNRCKNGTFVDIEGSADPILDEEGEIIGFLGIQRDVTERKHSEQVQKVLYNISNAAIVSQDLEALIRHIKKELELVIDTTNFYVALYNPNTDTFSLPLRVDEMKDSDSFPAHKTFSKYIISTKKPLLADKDEVKRMVKKGKVEIVGPASEIWLGVPLKVKGEVIGVLAVQSYTDSNAYNDSDLKMLEFIADHISISIERKKVEGNLNEQAVFVGKNPAPVFRTNYDGEIIALNNAATIISKELEIGKFIYSIFNNLNPSVLIGLVTNKQTQIEEEIGKNIYLFTILKDGPTNQIYYFGSNITQLKKAEQNLKSALNKATESDRLKSTFLATISHELRTPLNAIIGFSDLVNNEMSFNEVLSYNKSINFSGNQLLKIVENLFEITLIESGEIKIFKEDVSLHSILNNVFEIIKIYQHTTEKHDLDFSFVNAKENIDLIINTDSSKLKQILINLLKNAIKFTHKGNVNYGYTIETDNNSSLLKFYVEDTGIGIPKDKQKLIFEIFRQVDDTHSRAYEGTGIGLSIAKKLTELLGGKIWLESEAGKGCTFYFTVPYDEHETISQNKETITEKETKINNNSETKTVLIVEDDEASFEYLKLILEQSQISALWVKDGVEAIKHCQDNPDIVVVLMDINMPVMNGYEATKEIKTFRPDLPIIAQTAYAISGDREKSLEAGCDDYISKPIKKEELIEKIVKLVST